MSSAVIAKSRRKRTGPTVSDLILKAISVSAERAGVSLAALKEALKAGGYDVDKNNGRILNAIRRLLANKSLAQTTGKKALTPQKKTVVKETRRTSAKKAAGGDTPAAKKSSKRRRKAKGSKKAKRSAASKKPKKPGTPKNTMRRLARSHRTKK